MIESLEAVVMMFLEQEALVIGLGLIGLGLYFVYKKFEDEEMYPEKDPSELTRELLKKELENGKKVKKTLKDKREQTLFNRGRIMYQLDDEMPEDPISPVIDPDSNEGDEDGNIKTDKGLWMFKVIPENKSFVEYIIKDVIFSMDEVSQYYILEKNNVQMYNDEVVISEGVFLDYERGVFTDRTDSSKNKPNMLLRLASQTELVKGHFNYAPKVNYMHPAHTMNLDEISERNTEEDEI